METRPPDSTPGNAGRILGVLLLAAARGSTITISADGTDERDALAALVALVQSGFGDDVCGA